MSCGHRFPSASASQHGIDSAALAQSLDLLGGRQGVRLNDQLPSAFIADGNQVMAAQSETFVVIAHSFAPFVSALAAHHPM
jgi:hypothetical protein